jgi:hypothetical protein
MWERAEARASGQARVLSVLSIAYPEETWDSLSRMSIGRRDGCLLALRERLLGSGLALYDACPRCNQSVEIALSTHDLNANAAQDQPAPADEGSPPSYQLEHGQMMVGFRLPDSTDLEAAGRCGDLESSRRLLLDRCVLAVSGPDGPLDLPGSELPDVTQEALEQQMDRLDPLAVPRVDLDCPECAAHWQARIDVSDVVLAELATEAQLLLRDVSTLARLYHWSEQSILGMSPRRRSAYLELA